MSDQCRLHGPPAIARKFLLSLVVAFQYICVYRIISIFTHSESGNRVSSCSRVQASSQGPRPCHHPGDPWRCVREVSPVSSTSASDEEPASPENTVPSHTACGLPSVAPGPGGRAFSLPQADSCPSLLPQAPECRSSRRLSLIRTRCPGSLPARKYWNPAIVTLSNTTLEAFNPICSRSCGLAGPRPAALQGPRPHPTQAPRVGAPTPRHRRGLRFEGSTRSRRPARRLTPSSLQAPPGPRCHHVYVPVISAHVRPYPLSRLPCAL